MASSVACRPGGHGSLACRPGGCARLRAGPVVVARLPAGPVVVGLISLAPCTKYARQKEDGKYAAHTGHHWTVRRRVLEF